MKASEIKKEWKALDKCMVDDFNSEAFYRYIGLEEQVEFEKQRRDLLGIAVMQILNLLIEEVEINENYHSRK